MIAETNRLDAEEINRILQARTLQTAERPDQDEPQAEYREMIGFSWGGERYALDITSLSEVQPLVKGQWSPVPCTPDFVGGAVNIRNRIYSMIDIGCFLGQPAHPVPETAHILLIEGQGPDREVRQLGLLADEVPQTLRLSPDDMQPPEPAVSGRALDMVQGVTSEMHLILDAGRLLSDPGLVVRQEVGPAGV